MLAIAAMTHGIMIHRDRLHATIERKPVDRPACWLGIPARAAVPALLDHFVVPDLDALRVRLDGDIPPVELAYHSPYSDAIYRAFDFAKAGRLVNAHRSLNTPGWFEDITDVAQVDQPRGGSA